MVKAGWAIVKTSHQTKRVWIGACLVFLAAWMLPARSFGEVYAITWHKTDATNNDAIYAPGVHDMRKPEEVVQRPHCYAASWIWQAADRWAYKTPAQLWHEQRTINPPGRYIYFSWNLHRSYGRPIGELVGHYADACRDESGRFVTYETKKGTVERFTFPDCAEGVRDIGLRFEQFAEGLKRTGGQIDYLWMDYEPNLEAPWSWAKNAAGDAWVQKRRHVEAILNDPRAPQLLEFLDMSASEVRATLDYRSPSGKEAISQYNARIGAVWKDAMNQGVLKPFSDRFLDVQSSEFFDSFETENEQHITGRGDVVWSDGWYGTASGRGYYGRMDIRPGGFGSLAGQVERTGLHYLNIVARRIAAQKRTWPEREIHPWIAWPEYGEHHANSDEFAIKTYAWFRELMIALAMRCGDGENVVFSWWNPRPPRNADPYAHCTPLQERFVSAVLVELNKRLNSGQCMPVDNRVDPPIDKPWLVSTVRFGRTVVRRIHVDEGISAVWVSINDRTTPHYLRAGYGVWIEHDVFDTFEVVNVARKDTRREHNSNQ